MEEADEIIETQKIQEKINRQEKVVSRSKSRGQRGSEVPSDLPSLTKINKESRDELRPNTAQVNERGISEERRRYEAKLKREQELKILELEDEREMAEKEQRAIRHLEKTERFLEKQGRSLSAKKRGRTPDLEDSLENKQPEEINLGGFKKMKTILADDE